MKDSFITVRVPNNTRLKFYAEASEYGRRPSDLIRELVEAFIENRLVIQPPSNRKELYHVA